MYTHKYAPVTAASLHPQNSATTVAIKNIFILVKKMLKCKKKIKKKYFLFRQKVKEFFV